jgi:hypothetical protein
MSIFSKFRSSKKTSDGRKSDQAEENPNPQPYRHIPTHAASDALSQAPPGAKAADDKRAIREQRKRRDEMIHHNSSLSPVTTAYRSSGSTSDDWGSTTKDQRKHPPIFPNISVPPSETSPRDACATLRSVKSSSTASSSRGSSLLFEIPSRNPRRHMQHLVPRPHPPYPQNLVCRARAAVQPSNDLAIPAHRAVVTAGIAESQPQSPISKARPSLDITTANQDS